MSQRYKNGSHYETHQRAAELHDLAAHAHRSAADHLGKQEHQTGQERSRQALEHSEQAYLHMQQTTLHHESNGRPMAAFKHNDIAALAYELWEAQGRPQGTAEVDWAEAAEELRART